MIAASWVARAGTGDGSTSTGLGTSSSGKVPTFTLDQAILTSLQRNPTLLNAEQEIKRTKGVIIQVRAQALPQVTAQANFDWTDPNLVNARTINTSAENQRSSLPLGRAHPALSLSRRSRRSGTLGHPPPPRPTATPGVRNAEISDISYSISVIGTQLIFNGTTFNQIRGTFFQRDSAYFSFRNILDQLLATVKTQFYQVVVDRELIKVQEQSVQLLETQLKDQQNRFEAGTVPRFNVLQAEVALYNQIPQLITAQNNYRIAKITLAKTLGLDFQPGRGENPPLDVIGEMPYNPRTISLVSRDRNGKAAAPFS